jgi:multiple sugar transport system permease protein
VAFKSTQYGLINNVIKSLGLPTPGRLWDKNSVVPTIVLIGLWNTGGTMVIFLAGCKGIPKM